MYSQNPYQTVEHSLQDIEQHQMKMITVQSGPLLHHNNLQPMGGTPSESLIYHNLQPMASAPSESRNIEQRELNMMPMHKEPSMYNDQSQSMMASAPTAPPEQIMTKEQAIINYQPVGPTSTNIMCPCCQSKIKTVAKHRPSTGTHILGLLLCSICCCCLPYFIDSCRKVDHTCPNCNAFLGTYS